MRQLAAQGAPGSYPKLAEYRVPPAEELLDRLSVARLAHVTGLRCGPRHLIRMLPKRWSDAIEWGLCEWVSPAGMRPVIARLEDKSAERVVLAYRKRLAEVYPQRKGRRTLIRVRRRCIVARVA